MAAVLSTRHNLTNQHEERNTRNEEKTVLNDHRPGIHNKSKQGRSEVGSITYQRLTLWVADKLK